MQVVFNLLATRKQQIHKQTIPMPQYSKQPMRIILGGLVGTLLSFANVAMADPWTDGGSSVYVTDTSDIVGIGTTSPSTKLHVNYDGNSYWGLRLNNTYTGGRNWVLGDGVSAHGGFSIYDATASADRFFIASTGKIGIGTASPSRLIHLSNSASDTGIRIESTGTGADFLLYSGVGSADKFGIYDEDASTDRLVIDSSGNIGIGTASPGVRLDVNGDAAINNKLFGPSSTNLDLESQSGQDIRLNTNGSNERMRITSGGNVGIGTSSSSIDLAIGDSDTGLEQVSDGELAIKTNGSNALKATSNQNIRIGSTTGYGKLYVKDTDSWAIEGISDTVDDSEGGVFGQSTVEGSYKPIGIWGVVQADGASGGSAVGVRGDATSTDAAGGATFGVLGYVHRTLGNTSGVSASAGVYGGAIGGSSAMAHGVQGETNSTQTGASGVFGHATASSGSIIGVYGQTSSTSGYGVFSAGPSGATGYKSAIVPTSTGAVELYVKEDAEIYFEDMGFAKLIGGYARVDLDPLWLETVTINVDHPMHVFVQAYDDTNIKQLIVIRSDGYFEVFEADGGTSNAEISWQVDAKRKGYEDKRLNGVDSKLLELQPAHLDEYLNAHPEQLEELD